MKKDLKTALKFAEALGVKSGKKLLSGLKDIGSLECKDSIDFSTKYDKSVEREMWHAITTKYPQDGFVGEEDKSLHKNSGEYVWYVDPVDGTKYFGRQVPMFTTVVGLTYKDSPVLGVVYNPSSNQLYSGAVGVESFINNKQIKAGSKTKLKESILALELGGEDKEWESKVISQFLKHLGRIRVFGNATLSICWSLQGALAGYVDLFGMLDHDKKQDLIAPLAIAKEAGMEVREIKLGNKTKLICVIPSIADEVEKIVRS